MESPDDMLAAMRVTMMLLRTMKRKRLAMFIIICHVTSYTLVKLESRLSSTFGSC
jgi:hypothetical protein